MVSHWSVTGCRTLGARFQVGSQGSPMNFFMDDFAEASNRILTDTIDPWDHDGC